jgi:cytochrome c peroxidase
MRHLFLSLLFLVAISSIHWGQAESLKKLQNEPIQPLPQVKRNTQKNILGEMLFLDVKLSKNNTISCASCHNLKTSGADHQAFSVGINGAVGEINTPSVFNSSLNFRQFWNGRAKSLEEQIDGPVQHPKEMGAQWSDVIVKLKQDKSYPSLFAKLYPDGINQKNIKDAIASFERSLITQNSRFDRYLKGDQTALLDDEKKGYALFKSNGCIACHQGTNVGGNMFQTMGVMGNYFNDRGGPLTEADMGRFSITKNINDKFIFRVPSLRNVELTAPYFHDGSAKSLHEAVNVMAKYQLGLKLNESDVTLIVKFLKTLTGEIPKSQVNFEKKTGVN